MTMALAVAMVACQGAVGQPGKDGAQGPKGEKGDPGTSGAPGTPGQDAHTAVIATKGISFRAVNDEMMDGTAVVGTPPSPYIVSDYFLGGFPEVTYKVSMPPTTVRAFNLAVEDETVTITKDDAASLSEAEVYTTGDVYIITATDDQGFTADKTVVVFANKKPVPASTVPSDLTGIMVGTQDEYADPDATTGCDAKLNTSCVSVPTDAFTDDGHAATAPASPLVNANLKYSSTSKAGVLMAEVSDTGELKLTGTGVPMNDDGAFSADVSLKLTATDVGDLASDPLNYTVTVDPAPWPKGMLNEGAVLELAISTTADSTIDVSSYFGNHASPDAEILEYSVTKISPDNLPVSPDDGTAGTAGVDHLDATIDESSGILSITAKAVTSQPVTITIRATESDQDGPEQWAEQTLKVRVVRPSS